MSQLEKLTTHDIWCPDEGSVAPGKWVKHVKDDNSWGMCVGRCGELNTDVLVLWSRQPRFTKIVTQQINSTPRKLRAKWTAVEADTKFIGDFSFLGRSPHVTFEGEETYHQSEIDESFKRVLEADHADITYHMDGHITVRRKTDRLPDDVDPKDVSVRRSRW